MIPFRLLRLGLDPFELATFVVLRKHGDKDGKDIYPRLETLMAETRMGRERLWKSLNGLRDLGVIEWDSGGRGRSNRYRIRPMGNWSSPREHYNDLDRVRHANAESSASDTKSSPRERHLDPVPRSMNYSAPAGDEDETQNMTPEQRRDFFRNLNARIFAGIAERSADESPES